MAPIALDTTTTAPAPAHPVVKPVIRDYFGKPVDQPLVFLPPANAQARYAKAGIDISSECATDSRSVFQTREQDADALESQRDTPITLTDPSSFRFVLSIDEARSRSLSPLLTHAERLDHRTSRTSAPTSVPTSRTSTLRREPTPRRRRSLPRSRRSATSRLTSA